MRKLLVLIILFCSMSSAFAQVCTNLGQNPGTAFPVCGTSSFVQNSVAICGSRTIPTPCTAAGSIFQDKNPYWYKFTCFRSGTLAFEIVPMELSDDYDWQLFDVTNRNPADVYTDNSMFVACNWSGEGGRTGANASGTSLVVCEGYGKPLYSKMPDLVQGHDYLLLVSHYTNTQSGYSLAFGGGTASIVDTTVAKVSLARPDCEGKKISIKLNKNMRCSSLAGNGTDFTLSSATSKIVSATGVNCTGGFDMDSLVLTLDNALTAGTYTLTSAKGSDGNTLLDYCSNPMSEGLTITFDVAPFTPTPFDSITKVGCAPNELQVVFKKPILCSSIDPAGTDFNLDPSTGTTITKATTTCTNGSTFSILLTLSKALTKAGSPTLTLVKGTDGNTLINECGQETPAGSKVTFSTADTVSANIAYAIQYGCKADTVQFANSGTNGVTQWAWKFNDRAGSTQQNPRYVYTQFGTQQVSLFVSNGVCRDSAAVNFILDNALKAGFSGPTLLCPQDPAIFKDSSIGTITNWTWDFGNGASSLLKAPPQQNYSTANNSQVYNVRLIVQNNRDCADTLVKQIRVLNNCYIAVPTAFTPNGDGLNEFLYPTNAFKAADLEFKVYNRLGQVIFESRDNTRKWDGTYKGYAQPPGTYVWTLSYRHVDTNERFTSKGTTVLIR